jgi:poly-gamma-glutamate synthesis protein (capsule biosynthesis protein)
VAVVVVVVVVSRGGRAVDIGRRSSARLVSDPKTFDPQRRQPLKFAHACDAGDVVTLGFLGDVLVHNAPHAQARQHGFSTLWAPIAPLLAAPDLTYANLEGTFDAKATARSSHGNRMIYDPALAQALANDGVDVVSTANNHGLDGNTAGLRQTLDVLDAAKIVHTGTRRNAAEQWFTTTTAKGLRFAWIACAEWSNESSARSLMLGCHRDRSELLALVKALAKGADVDVVVVTPHGGREGLPRADTVTRELHEALVDAGALIVVGNHPHALQQWEKRATPDGREAFVSTCSGASFTGLKKESDRRAGAFVVVGVARGPDGKARIRGVRHVPLEWSRKSGVYEMIPASEAIQRRVYASLSSWNQHAPSAPFDVVPQCREGYVDVAAVLGREKEACDNDTQCERGLRCVVGTVDGRCTR